VTFHVPVLDPARAPATRAREAGASAAETRRGAELLRQQRVARVLFAHWRSAAERRRLAEAVVDRAESHFLRTKSLYAAGATTLFDLLDSLQLLKEARVRRAEAREELRMVRLQIEERL
jgi:outer membrane protein TolC